MHFKFTPEQEQFRHEVSAFVEAEWHGGEGEVLIGEGSDEAWHAEQAFRKKLAQRRWLTLAWPPEWGGCGASPVQQTIYNEVMAYYGAPGADMGADRIGPTLMLFGTDQQKREFLPGIVAGQSTWCQGFSEPNAGSDLANLQTRAVEDGDYFIINGQKIWISNAHRADLMFLLARTDPEAPKHRGISAFLVDMQTPGIKIAPLVNMAGGHGFSQVFFDNVRISRERLVGEKNQGWYVATKTLDFERSGIGRIAPAQRVLKETITFVRGQPLAEAQCYLVRTRLAEFAIEYEVGRLLAYHVAWLQEQGEVPNYEASLAKTFGSEMQQRLAGFLINLCGLYGQLTSAWAPLNLLASEYYLKAAAFTIAAGTSEIQRNIIATRGLGLPRG